VQCDGCLLPQGRPSGSSTVANPTPKTARAERKYARRRADRQRVSIVGRRRNLQRIKRSAHTGLEESIRGWPAVKERIGSRRWVKRVEALTATTRGTTGGTGEGSRGNQRGKQRCTGSTIGCASQIFWDFHLALACENVVFTQKRTPSVQSRASLPQRFLWLFRL